MIAYTNIEYTLPATGTHSFKEVLLEGIKPLIVIAVFLLIGCLISKKISKKAIRFNTILYSILLITYVTTAFLKAYKKINIPPHNILKDMCTLQFDLFIVVIVWIIPFIYSILLLAKWGDTKIKEKKDKVKENKNEL